MNFNLSFGNKKKDISSPSENAVRDNPKMYTGKSIKDPLENNSEEANPTEEIIRFDNTDELENAFKKGSLNWPKHIEVNGLRYNFIKSGTNGGMINIVKYNQPGYIIYTVQDTDLENAKNANMGQWMVFLFKAESPSKIVPQGITFTTKTRGSAMYEAQQEVIGDIALLKIALPTGVIALKGKVDTGAEISSLHVDSTPRIIGDIVKFENHNASSNIISAPLVAKQAVKSADGGVEYRPVIELDIEINGKKVSKAQFNLNNRSKMEHEVLIGQNILEKTGFLVDPNINNIKENDKIDIDVLTENELNNLMTQISIFIEE